MRSAGEVVCVKKEGHQTSGGLSWRTTAPSRKDAAHNRNNKIAIAALIHVKTPRGALFRVTGVSHEQEKTPALSRPDRSG